VTAPIGPDQMPIPIVIVNRTGGVIVNETFEDMLGRHHATHDLELRLPLATSRDDLSPEAIAAAVAAAHTRAVREVSTLDEARHLGLRALVQAGSSSWVAYPLRIAGETAGALVVVWRHAGASSHVGSAEVHELRRLLRELVIHRQRAHEQRVNGHDLTHRAFVGMSLPDDNQDGGRFTEEDEHVLDLFGSQAALTIGCSHQLQRADEAMHQLASLHDELSAVIAHEMRSPISSILLRIELLLEHGERQGDQIAVPIATLRRLRDAGQRISRMAEDLLNASRIELGRMALDLHAIALADAVGKLVAELEPTLGGRAVAIDSGRDVPLVSADPLRLGEIVTNLVENAAKYSATGRPIRIHIERDGDGAQLSVEDEGPGIPQDEIPKLFDRFFQATRPRATKTGLGLGLYITKGLVAAHKGRIWVDSVVGRGSRFHVWLPSADAPDRDP